MIQAGYNPEKRRGAAMAFEATVDLVRACPECFWDMMRSSLDIVDEIYQGPRDGYNGPLDTTESNSTEGGTDD